MERTAWIKGKDLLDGSDLGGAGSSWIVFGAISMFGREWKRVDKRGVRIGGLWMCLNT
jgi:hypothetical protein